VILERKEIGMVFEKMANMVECRVSVARCEQAAVFEWILVSGRPGEAPDFDGATAPVVGIRVGENDDFERQADQVAVERVISTRSRSGWKGAWVPAGW